MKGMRVFTVLLFCMSWMISIGQVPEKGGKPVPSSYCLSPIEYKLYNMINDYRQRYDLPPVPLSKSLCFVAATHAKDLFIHHPDQGPCKQYSWSDQGFWKPFCYPRDENKKNSVWDKPKELTTYKGKGYEITYWENSEVVIDSIMTLWKSMDYFNAFLMNTGKWQGRKWNAIGIGIYENYACAWFGELSDPEGEPFICGQEPRKPGSTPVVKATPPEKKVPETKKVQEAKVPADKKAKEAAATSTGSEASTVPGNEYYYIIVKGIAPEKELQRFLKDLQSKGYSSAKLLEKNGKQRVSIMGFPDKSKADSALRQVKKSWPDAWILKQ